MVRFRSDYPGWHLTRNVDDIIDEMIAAELARVAGAPLGA